MTRILLRELDQLATDAALRNVYALAWERFLDELSVWKIKRKHELRGMLRHADVAAREEQPQHVRIILAVHVLHEAVLAREQLSLSYAQQRNDRVVAIARVSDHVAIAALDA